MMRFDPDELLAVSSRFSEHVVQIKKIAAEIDNDAPVICPYYSGERIEKRRNALEMCKMDLNRTITILEEISQEILHDVRMYKEADKC